MKIRRWATVLLFWAASASAGPSINQEESGVSLRGYDPVTYFTSKEPQKGDAKIRVQHLGATYLFVNEADKQEFLKDPKKYAPQYGGWCAYAVANSKSKVDVDPKSYLIQDGRLLLFYNGIWGDTRKKWLKDSQTLLKTADANWPEVERKDP